MSEELFTPRQREIIAANLSAQEDPNLWLIACEKGFLDHVEGVPVSDKQAKERLEGTGKKIEDILD